ncbi:hypothetical protein BP6252_05603 [Coleophoma cylindrospora]|uniref:Uncharacterized protein n=1 Tax=Coleophoma cylindrospora TaxID=1849047 RepID=A0A3D8RUB6_9HELO|nr:hypothetical protein BP6252_05603 [Coleophoma cylindrospora]
MWLITLENKLHLAPISATPHNVLDLATGTGIWAIEFADAFPTANVTGTDLSLIQPSYVPPNCRFEIDDVEDEWLFSNKFDYIHGRALATCFNDGASVVRKAYDALEPGGWFELQDFELQKSEDDSMKGTNFEAMEEHISEAMKKLGRTTWGGNVPNYARWFREAGFEGVTETQFRWPSNPHWPTSPKEKLLGAWWQVQIEAGLLESLSTRIYLSVLGWTKEELTVFLAMVRKEENDPNIRAYVPVHIVYGQKPLEE